jgi:SAM-dependent methyltransferase
VPDASLDFVWSFDSVVHMDPPVVRAYLREIGRVLRPGGSAVVHHADKRPWSLALTPVMVRLGTPGRVIQQLASQGRLRDDGNRSNVTGRMVADWAQAAGMVVMQTRSWRAENQYDVAKYRDLISSFRKPPFVSKTPFAGNRKAE